MINELFELNCSTIFLLQPLGLSRKKLGSLGFVNAYLQDKHCPLSYIGNMVFLLFKPGEEGSFRYFTDTERLRTPLFIDEYDYEGGYTVLVYEFPDALSGDFELFRQGKYSRFSEAFRATIGQELEVVIEGVTYTQPTMQHAVITRLPEWKAILEEEWGVVIDSDQDLWKRPSNEEVLDIYHLDKKHHD